MDALHCTSTEGAKRVVFKIRFRKYNVKLQEFRKRIGAADPEVLGASTLVRRGHLSMCPVCKQKAFQRLLSSGGAGDSLQLATKWLTGLWGKSTPTNLLESDPRCPVTIRYCWLRTF
jgi:hypothetical protein